MRVGRHRRPGRIAHTRDDQHRLSTADHESRGLGAGGKSFVPARVAARVQAGGRLLLSLEGVFECSLITLDLPPGRHTIIAASEHASRPSVKARFTLAGPTDDAGDGGDAPAVAVERPFERFREFFRRRFSTLGAVSLGARPSPGA